MPSVNLQELDDEELAASRQRRRAKDDDGEMYDEFGRLKRKNRKTYHEAIEVVMQYGEVRVPIADFNLKNLEQARTLVFRLQNACASVDMMNEYITPAAPEKRRADQFDPAPDIG